MQIPPTEVLRSCIGLKLKRKNAKSHLVEVESKSVKMIIKVIVDLKKADDSQCDDQFFS